MMAKQMLRPVGIVGIGSYLPSCVLTNAQIEEMVETSDEWIRTRTGISERRIADKEMATSDMATIAAKRALESAGVKPEEIDLIIVATVTPDMAFPSTACIVQKNLGAGNCPAFDLEAACTGFIYGLSVASQFIGSGTYETALVIGADILSRITDWEDRNTCILFGDGAGAAVLKAVPEGRGILSSILHADGSGGEFLFLPAGGSKYPPTHETIDAKMHYTKMRGNEVFKFAVKIMGEAVLEALDKCGLNQEDLDWIIPHQANIRIIEAAQRRLSLPEEKVIKTINKYGNMSSATIPVALDEAIQENRIKEGDLIAIVAFGAGLTSGASIIRW